MAFSLGNSSALRAARAGHPARQSSSRRAATLRVAAAAPAKGFGKQAAGPLKDGCPCGSNKYYRDCCKRYHGGQIATSLEDTCKARFSAVVKKVRECGGCVCCCTVFEYNKRL